jgi:hypothetical protein
MEIKLTINNIELEVGIEFAKEILNCLPDDIRYSNIYHEIAQSSISNIRNIVSCKDNLSEETAKLLLSDEDDRILEDIVGNSVAHSIADDEDIYRIIENGSQSTIISLISYLDDFDDISTNKIYAKLLEMDNLDITYQIAGAYNAPKSILKKLAKHSDPDIAKAAKDSLE